MSDPVTPEEYGLRAAKRQLKKDNASLVEQNLALRSKVSVLADALAASQEALRRAYALLLAGDAREAEAVLYRRLSALDSTQTHGGGERPEGWPDKCANCGADWTQISYDHALGFNCQSCGGSDADE